jgi:hypothetical protein
LVLATIEVGSNFIWIDIVAICLAKNCSVEGELFSVVLHKPIDAEYVDLLAGFPHIIDDIFNGSRMLFGLL